MPMYNLLGYSDNNSMTSGTMWDYQADEVDDDAKESDAAGIYRINNNNTTASKSRV